MFAIRVGREYVIEEDFFKAARKIKEAKKLESKLDYSKIWLFHMFTPSYVLCIEKLKRYLDSIFDIVWVEYNYWIKKNMILIDSVWNENLNYLERQFQKGCIYE